MLLSASCIFKAVRYLLNFLQTVITVKELTKGEVVTSLVNYKVILFQLR